MRSPQHSQAIAIGAFAVAAFGVAFAPAASATSPSADCDASTISRDLAQQVNILRCYGDWAYVGTGELGDAQSLLRLIDGTWTRYAGFPSTICSVQAAADGVPNAELSSFPTC